MLRNEKANSVSNIFGGLFRDSLSLSKGRVGR